MGNVTDPTPTTEAGRRLFATHAGFRHRILAIEAEARAEGLDVGVLRRAAWDVVDRFDRVMTQPEGVWEIDDEAAIERLRAILAGGTDR